MNIFIYITNNITDNIYSLNTELNDQYYYDVNEVVKIHNFYSRILRHIDGDKINTPAIPAEWMFDALKHIYGVKKRCDDTRRYTEVYIEIPRKNGKSWFVASVALYELVYGEQRGYVVVGALSREQAKILFDMACDLVRYSPILKKACKIYKNEILCTHNNSTFKVISRDAKTAQGYNPSVGIVDELHVQPDSELYDSLQQGQSLRRQPLMIGITTAGISGKESFGYRKHMKAINVLTQKSIDESLYVKIYGLESNDDWHDENNWVKVNPILNELPSKINTMRNLYVKARESKEDEYAFRRYALNTWLSTDSAWITDDVFMNCGNNELDINDYKNCDCYVGVDLSSNTDLTSVSLCFYENGMFSIFVYVFCPEENIAHRSKRDKVPYVSWRDQDYLISTPGNATDYDYIINKLNELHKIINIKRIAIDRWGASYLIQKIQNEGFEVVTFGQGYGSMSPATKFMERCVLRNELQHNNHPILRWCMSNVTLVTDAAGNIKPSKEKSVDRIDAVISTIMALEICSADVQSNSGGNISWT